MFYKPWRFRVVLLLLRFCDLVRLFPGSASAAAARPELPQRDNDWQRQPDARRRSRRTRPLTSADQRASRRHVLSAMAHPSGKSCRLRFLKCSQMHWALENLL